MNIIAVNGNRGTKERSEVNNPWFSWPFFEAFSHLGGTRFQPASGLAQSQPVQVGIPPRGHGQEAENGQQEQHSAENTEDRRQRR